MRERPNSDAGAPDSVTVDGVRPQARGPGRLGLPAGLLLLALGGWTLYALFGTDNASSTTEPPPGSSSPATSGLTEVQVCEALPFTAAPLPGAAGNEMIIVTKPGEILRLDLGSGRLTCVRPVPTSAEGRPPWAQGYTSAYAAHIGSGTFVQNWATWLVPDDPSLPAQKLDEEGFVYAPAATPDTVWQFTPGMPGATVRLLGLAAGLPSSELTLPSDGWVRSADGSGHLIVKTRSSYSALEPDGTIVILWEGNDLLTINAATALARTCETASSCRLVSIDRRSGETTDLGQAPAELTVANPIRATDPAPLQGLMAVGLSLSPGGTLLAATGFYPEKGSLSGPLIFDLETGEKHEPAAGLIRDALGFSWLDDGSMLFWVDHDGGIRVWRRDQPLEATLIAGEILPRAIALAIDN